MANQVDQGEEKRERKRGEKRLGAPVLDYGFV